MDVFTHLLYALDNEYRANMFLTLLDYSITLETFITAIVAVKPMLHTSYTCN